MKWKIMKKKGDGMDGLKILLSRTFSLLASHYICRDNNSQQSKTHYSTSIDFKDFFLDYPYDFYELGPPIFIGP